MCLSLEIIKSFNLSKLPSTKSLAPSLWFARIAPTARLGFVSEM